MSDQNLSNTMTSYINQLREINNHLPFSHVDMIIDQAGLKESLVPLLTKFGSHLVWSSLLTDLPEEGLIENAPLLIRIQWDISAHHFLLEEILKHLYQQPRILFIYSELRFDSLFEKLKSQLEITWGKQNCLLRFYDPRIFPELMSHILTDEQRQHFNQIVSMWGWLNRDLKMSWLPGLYHPDTVISQSAMMELSDKQFDMLDGISDVTLLMKLKKFSRTDLTNEQNFSFLYQLTLQFIDSDHFGDLNSYILQHHQEQT